MVFDFSCDATLKSAGLDLDGVGNFYSYGACAIELPYWSTQSALLKLQS